MARWAKFLKVSRSGYYGYLKVRKEREKSDEKRKKEITKIFNNSEGSYGPDRICGILREQGEKASYKKTSRQMNEMGLVSVYNLHKTRSLTDSRKARGKKYDNLLIEKVPERPYEAVCSDITYLRSSEGWVYLCIVKDIVTGEILGESFGHKLKKELVIKAFLNAHARHNLLPGTIFHSDCGSQYLSKAFRNLLKSLKIRQSFSRIGRPGDNTWAESFFSIMKKECVHFKHFPTRDSVQQAVFRWIESFYNTRRVQKKLGYISPREYAKKLLLCENEKTA